MICGILFHWKFRTIQSPAIFPGMTSRSCVTRPPHLLCGCNPSLADTHAGTSRIRVLQCRGNLMKGMCLLLLPPTLNPSPQTLLEGPTPYFILHTTYQCALNFGDDLSTMCDQACSSCVDAISLVDALVPYTPLLTWYQQKTCTPVQQKPDERDVLAIASTYAQSSTPNPLGSGPSPILHTSRSA